MQIQRINFTPQNFCREQNVRPKTKDETAIYNTLYDYYVDYYNDGDPDYGDINDPNAVRNLSISHKKIDEQARIDAKNACDSHMYGGSGSDDFDVDRCFDVVV